MYAVVCLLLWEGSVTLACEGRAVEGLQQVAVNEEAVKVQSWREEGGVQLYKGNRAKFMREYVCKGRE